MKKKIKQKLGMVIIMILLTGYALTGSNNIYASCISEKGKAPYTGYSVYNDDEKKAEELLEDYMQPGEIPDIVWSESADTIRGRNLKSCIFFDGEGLNGIREAWNNNWDEKALWISKIHIPPFFHVWIEEETIMTDYPAWLFASTLYLTMEEGIHAGKWDYCLDASMPSDSQYAIPYYSLLEEPLVLFSDAPANEIEPVFRAVYERMHEIQMQVDADLSQEIRFGVNAEAEWEAYQKYQPEENFASLEEWLDTMAVEGYNTWKRVCGEYVPPHEISFYLPYEEGGAELFDVLMEDRDRYLAHMDLLKENGEAEPINKDNKKYTVQNGDCLWNIAETFYGDGGLWVSLYEENREVIGENPDLIFAGTQLNIR